MIRSFKHKGLERYFLKGEKKDIPAALEQKIRRILFRLHTSSKPTDITEPAYRLHPLKGDMKGYWSVWVNGNWRIIFRFEKDDVFDVELIDYH